MINKILIATNNKNKVKEIKEILDTIMDNNIELLTLKDLGIDYDVDETGFTFEFNAKKKAKEYYELAKIPVIAEDSGLCIPALNNLPGVYSKRIYEGHTEEYGNNVILENLNGIKDRSAYYTAVYCYYDGETEIITNGIMEGFILQEIKGDNGFAYDKIFLSTELNKRVSYATDEEKNSVSHRRKGLVELFNILNGNIEETKKVDFENMTYDKAIEYCYKHEDDFIADLGREGIEQFEGLIALLEMKGIHPKELPDYGMDYE